MVYDDDDRTDDPMFKRWAKAVKVRDNFTCQVCGKRGVYLESHHLNAWQSFPDERFDLSNGVTCCVSCHKHFHESFSYGDATKWQFEQFKKIANKFRWMLSREEGVDDNHFDDD